MTSVFPDFFQSVCVCLLRYVYGLFLGALHIVAFSGQPPVPRAGLMSLVSWFVVYVCSCHSNGFLTDGKNNLIVISFTVSGAHLYCAM